MQRGCRRAHYYCADFERDVVGKRECVPPGNSDEFRITAVPVFANHLSAATKLFQAAHTKLAAPAVNQIMYANAVSHRNVRHVPADFVHASRDFVSESQR